MDTELDLIRTDVNHGAAYYERVAVSNGDGVANRNPDATERDGLPSRQVAVSNGDGVANRNPDATERDGLPSGQVAVSNGDGVANKNPDASERDGLLSGQLNSTNGEVMASGHAAEGQRNVGNEHASNEVSALCRIKRELTTEVYTNVKVWMVIVFIFFLIVAVILISLALCSVIHVDTDEEFDHSSFKVPHYYNGSFQMPNQVFTEEHFSFSSNESQALAADLQNTLANLYRSSTALGRYFSQASIYAFRNGSVTDYRLKFVLPEEGQDQLRKFTLSREMVYNVFRQFLYDQEPDESGPLYIDPVSLEMF